MRGFKLLYGLTFVISLLYDTITIRRNTEIIQNPKCFNRNCKAGTENPLKTPQLLYKNK